MTDPLALDHLVYAVPDLARGIDEVERGLGLAPLPGGRHDGLGTHNAILPLIGETYLELIARNPDGPMPNQPRPSGLDSLHSPRLVGWAIRSRKIESAALCRKVGRGQPSSALPPGLLLHDSSRSRTNPGRTRRIGR